ncbi:MAG: protein kinase [Pseudomonadota bacterium]
MTASGDETSRGLRPQLETHQTMPTIDSRILPDSMVDHFRVVRLVGRGGMGEVYLARDILLNRRIALKVIHQRYLNSEGAVARFMREAQLTASLCHPHIVTVYAVGTFAGRPYLALEYLEGQNLRQRMDEERPGVRESLRIALAIAQALAEAHRHRVLHRDLKPENVVLAKDGRLRLVDLGLAKIRASASKSTDAGKALDGDRRSVDGECDDRAAGYSATCDHATEAGTIQGTPAYMAPEQWRGEECNEATDVWALGVMLHELLVGKRPYRERGAAELRLAVTRPEPAPSLVSSQDTPADLVELVGGCLNKESRKRPAAAQIVDALDRLLSEGRRQASSEHCPFRGLFPFAEHHADSFFGRDHEIAVFLESLREQAVLPVVGPSGAGKSSFVQAGVIPRLREQGAWMALAIRPGADPFGALAARLIAGQSIRRIGDSADSIIHTADLEPPEHLRAMAGAKDAMLTSLLASEGDDVLASRLRQSPATLGVLLHDLAVRERCKVLLFVDQLEEVYTMVADGAVREAFVRAICGVADHPSSPVRAVFTIRDDFLGHLSGGTEVAMALARVFALRRPGKEALEEVLTRPLAAVGYAYDDPALTAVMVESVKDEPACLPLLQFAGQMLWERRDKDKRLLCRATYEAMGGVAGSLAEHADGVLAGMASAQVELARQLLLRLVTSAGTRRAVPVATAIADLGPGIGEVLDRLTQARLLTVRRTADGRRQKLHPREGTEGRKEKGKSAGTGTDRAPATAEGASCESDGEAVLEIVHESLVRTWGRLARWLEESHEELAVLAEISQAAELWEKRGRRADEVWQGDALADARRKLARLSTAVPEQVAGFLKAGLRKENRQRRRRRVLAVGTMVFLAAVAMVSLWRERETRLQKERAEIREAEAQARRAEAQREGSRAALSRGDLLEARAKLRGSLETQDSLLGRALWWRLEQDPLLWRRELGDQVPAVAFSPDGATVAATANDRLVYLLDSRTEQARFLRGPDGHAFLSVAFAPDGRLLAAGTSTGAIALWDLDQGTVRSLAGHSNVVHSVAFSPDSQRLASGSEDRTVRIWDTATAQPVRMLAEYTTRVLRVAFSPDGSRFASTEAAGVHLWNAVTWSRNAVLAGNDGLAFGPDGSWLASGSRDQSIRLWDVVTGSQRAALRGHSRQVLSLGASQDGRTLVSGSSDGTVRIWDLASSSQRHAFVGAKDEVLSVSISPDDALVASAGRDKSVRLWRIASQRATRKTAGHEATIYRIATSPDGRFLATGGADRTVRIWDASSGVQLMTLEGSAGEVRGVAISPDGRLVAASSSDRNIWVWSLASPGRPRLFSGHHSAVDGLAFSPDGGALASAGADRSVRLWDLATGRERHLLVGHAVQASDVAMSPDGKLLASSSYDRTVRIWNATSGAQLRVLAGHQDLIWAIDFAPDGKTVASASWDKTVRLWDLATGTSKILGEHQGNVYSVAFHPDGRHVGTAAAGGAVRIWDLASGEFTDLRGHRRDVIAIRYTPDGRTIATAGV